MEPNFVGRLGFAVNGPKSNQYWTARRFGCVSVYWWNSKEVV
jgi:hypothetical protein